MSAPSPSRIAASLMTRSFRSTAAIVRWSSRKPSRSIPAVKVSIQPIASTMSRRAIAGVLDDNEGVLCGALPDFIFQETAIGEVNRRIQNAGKAELQADQIEKTQGFRAVEVGDEIHVGIGGLFTARN